MLFEGTYFCSSVPSVPISRPSSNSNKRQKTQNEIVIPCWHQSSLFQTKRKQEDTSTDTDRQIPICSNKHSCPPSTTTLSGKVLQWLTKPKVLWSAVNVAFHCGHRKRNQVRIHLFSRETASTAQDYHGVDVAWKKERRKRNSFYRKECLEAQGVEDWLVWWTLVWK